MAGRILEFYGEEEMRIDLGWGYTDWGVRKTFENWERPSVLDSWRQYWESGDMKKLQIQ